MKLFTKKYLPLFVMLISIIAIMATTIGCETAADDEDTVSPYYFYTDKDGVKVSTGADWSRTDSATGTQTEEAADGADGSKKHIKLVGAAGDAAVMTTYWSLAQPADNATDADKAKLAAQLANLSKHTTFVLWAKGTKDDTITISLTSPDPADATKTKIATATVTLTAAEWTKYETKLADFTGVKDVDLAQIANLSLTQGKKEQTTSIDEVYAIK